MSAGRGEMRRPAVRASAEVAERVLAVRVIRGCARLMFDLAAPVLCGVCIGLQEGLEGVPRSRRGRGNGR
jgi:hypothetical protein